MKMNQAVLNRVYKKRERSGFKTVDTKSVFYKTAKFLYFASFLWYSFNIFITALGWTLFYEDFTAVKRTDLFNTVFVWVLLAATTVSCVLIIKKKHEIGICCNLVSVTTGLILFDHYLSFYQRGIDDSYFMFFGKAMLYQYVWKVFAPAMLMYIFCAVVCIIAYREKRSLRKDYNTVLEALYINNKDRLHSGSEEEWEKLLNELDDEEVDRQLDKYHTQQYLKRKAAKKAKEQEKQKDSEEE